VREARDVALDAFGEAAGWYRTVVSRVPAGAWDGPGLGVWSVRELVGHIGRALSTTEQYLRSAPSAGALSAARAGSTAPAEADGDQALCVELAASYFLGLRDNDELHDDVAERGRQAGAELPLHGGPSTLDAATGEQVSRVLDALADAPRGAWFETRFGAVAFAPYILTRTVELVVHCLDVARACGTPTDVPPRCAGAVMAVLGQLAVQRGSADAAIGALAGRSPLPDGFGLFS
jgi:Mycothiol maleylpyruvate isomerase N-terminal domain